MKNTSYALAILLSACTNYVDVPDPADASADAPLWHLEASADIGPCTPQAVVCFGRCGVFVSCGVMTDCGYCPYSTECVNGSCAFVNPDWGDPGDPYKRPGFTPK